MSKRILLISYYFAPQNVIGAIRPTKLAKYLTRMGYDLTVVCGTGMTGARDPMLARDLAELASVRVVRERSLFRWWKERGLPDEPARAIVQPGRLPEKGTPEETMAKPAGQPSAADCAAGPARAAGADAAAAVPMRRRLLDALYLWLADRSDAVFARACIAELLRMDQHFDIVLSCYGPHSVHTAARYAKRLRVADRWIADFRDEASVHFPWQRAWLTRFMRRMRRSADAITAVSHGTLQMMRLESFGQVMPNGFDPEDGEGLTPARLGKQTLSLCYCGQLYPGKSDLTPVFQAVRALADEGLCDAARLRFHYAGRQGAAFAAQAASCGLGDRVVDHGVLPRAESLALQKGSDALLAATWNTPQRKGVLTGKLMEYMMADRPVLCCVSGETPGSEARAMVEHTRVGVCYEQAAAASDAPALRQYLRALYDARFAGTPSPYQPDREAVAAYDYRNIAAAFARLMENV